MAVTADILPAWRRPRRCIARSIWRGARPKPLCLVAAAGGLLVLVFVAQWPVAGARCERMRRRPSGDLPRIAARRVLAVLATCSAAAAGLCGWPRSAIWSRGRWAGKGGYYGARLALFWALVAIGPLMLLQGLVAGMIGPGRR